MLKGKCSLSKIRKKEVKNDMSTQGNVADYLINRSTCVAHSNNDSAADVATQTTHFHEHALFLADFFLPVMLFG